MTSTAISRSARAVLNGVASLHEACADPARLRLLNLLAGGELCVCDLQELTGESQPFVSRHLARLRAAALVHADRKGKFVYYRLADLSPHTHRQLDVVLDTLHTADAQLRRERGRAATLAARRGVTPCE